METTITTTTLKGDTFYNDTDIGKKISMFITLFILILVFVWVILFSFNPKGVQKGIDGQTDPVVDAPPDPVYCFWGAFIISLIVVIIIAILKACF